VTNIASMVRNLLPDPPWLVGLILIPHFVFFLKKNLISDTPRVKIITNHYSTIQTPIFSKEKLKYLIISLSICFAILFISFILLWCLINKFKSTFETEIILTHMSFVRLFFSRTRSVLCKSNNHRSWWTQMKFVPSTCLYIHIHFVVRCEFDLILLSDEHMSYQSIIITNKYVVSVSIYLLKYIFICIRYFLLRRCAKKKFGVFYFWK